MSPSASDNPLKDNRGDDEDVSPPQQAAAVVILSDSDEDADVDEYNPSNMGYELLPQEPTDHHLDQQETNNGSRFVTVDGSDDQQHQQSINDAEASKDVTCTIGQKEAITPNDIAMDQDHIDKIKAAMASFTLPVSSFPAWANVVPEDQWKDRLMSLMSPQQQERPRVLS